MRDDYIEIVDDPTERVFTRGGPPIGDDATLPPIGSDEDPLPPSRWSADELWLADRLAVALAPSVRDEAAPDLVPLAVGRRVWDVVTGIIEARREFRAGKDGGQ